MAVALVVQVDPILTQVLALLAPIAGLGAQIQTTTATIGQITVNAVNTAAQQTQQGFGALADFIEVEAADSLGVVQDIIDNAALLQRQEIEAIGTALDGAVTTFQLANQAQLDATLAALGLATSTTQVAIQQAAEESQGFFASIGGAIADNILGIPGDFADIISDPLGAIQGAVQDLDGLLSLGFDGLGAILSLGFPLLTDTIAKIFDIDPEAFQEGIQRVLPAMVDMAKVAGDAILEE